MRRFALAVARPATHYISASVAGDMLLDGRTLVDPPTRPAEPFLAARGDWLGLPPAPPAWCWFGPSYARLLRGAVPGEPVAGGLLYTGGTWVPPRLRARLEEIDPAHRHAPRMPRGLRRNQLKLLPGR